MKIVCSLALTLTLLSCGKEPGPGPAQGSAPAPAAQGVQQSPASESPSAPPAPADAQRKYGVKSGIVRYELGTKAATLTKVYYFDDFGAKECVETIFQDKLTETQLCDGQERYTIRADEEKVAWNHGKTLSGLAKKITRASVAGSRGVTDLPAMTICDKECEVYSVQARNQTVTFAGWQGVQMLMETDSKTGAFERAVQAEFDVPVPAEKFKVPAGYEVKNL